MYISSETPRETEQRLLNVIASARVKVYDGAYAFEEFEAAEFRQKVNQNALAIVHDDITWSQLLPCTGSPNETFKIFSFHFKEGLDNSGFVGWLATRLKQKLGTGVFVVCGQNSSDGGIFDYWGCPYEVGEEVIEEIRSLMKK